MSDAALDRSGGPDRLVQLDRVVGPGETPASVTDRIAAIALQEKTHLWWWIAFGLAIALLGLGFVALGWLFRWGIQVWGNDWPVMWGFPIINYVWWIGIASGGTFISAFFFLCRADWRTSTNRLAETITIFAAACAGIYPILHLGRPWFFYWLYPYPNTMTLWPQFKSPLLWDFVCVQTYVFSSLMFYYLGMIPDLASLRDRARSRWQAVIYGALALGFRGTGHQWKTFHSVYGVIAAIMAPLVVSVHSVVGLDFAASATPGWASTQFPPFFVFGAILSGFGAVLVLILPLRRALNLYPYITQRHLDVLSRLLLTSALCVAYAYVMDAFQVLYGGEEDERHQFLYRIHDWVFWGKLILNCAVPLLFCFRAMRRNDFVVFAVAFSVVVGMWLERYEIVTIMLRRTNLPSAWGEYAPTFWDWALFAGTGGLFLAGVLLVVRLLPIISIAEMREMIAEKNR